MNLLEWGLGACGVAGLIGLGLRHKFKADAILQDGVWVGSALLGTPISEDAASFIVVRGAPAFREQDSFVHQGRSFLIVDYESVDTRSTVLRRLLNVRCRVLSAG